MSKKEIANFLNTLDELCTGQADEIIARGQKAYLRHQFEFYGIKTPVRRSIQKTLFQKSLLPSKQDLPEIIRALWKKEQRENQYIGQELAKKFIPSVEAEDHLLFQYMITHKSWWDTVDFIAINLVGSYFRVFPEKRDRITGRWMESGHLWLQRSVLLFQLKYKEELDTAFLSHSIGQLLGSREFFINKAIGWILREYSKTDGAWVRQFVQTTPLESLSKKEALRLMK
jgi:3-methyladenine DNA glycosylase AlkD